MTEEPDNGSMKLIILIVVVLAMAYIVITGLVKAKKESGDMMEELGARYAEPVTEPSFCKAMYDNIETSKMLREYVYYIDSGSCHPAQQSDAGAQQSSAEGKPAIKNTVTIRCDGEVKDEEYCSWVGANSPTRGAVVFDLSSGGKADMWFSNMYYVDTEACMSNSECNPEQGRNIYVCAPQKLSPSLLEYNKISTTENKIDRLVLKNDPNLKVSIRRSANNIVLCINSNFDYWDLAGEKIGGAYNWVANKVDATWKTIKSGWNSIIGKLT